MHTYVPWTEERLATSGINGAVVRLLLPYGGSFPSHIAGRESTCQVGMWTSSIHRPRGRFRYGHESESSELKQVNFVPAGIDWSAEMENSGPFEPAIFCDFESEYFYETTGVDPDQNVERLIASENDGITRQILRMLADELRAPGFSHAVKVDALCRLILVELTRQLERPREEPAISQVGKLAPWQLRRIRDVVETVEGRPIAVLELAEQCGISTPHLRRLFRASTGTSISSYVDKVRLDRAKSLLADRALPLKLIAHRLGFANASAFSAAFRRGSGTSPNKYRQQLLASPIGVRAA